MTNFMKSVVVPDHGGPEVYEIREQPVPTPDSGQALVRVSLAGVNYLDVAQRTGATPLQAPFAAGVEGLGTVTDPGDTGLNRGARVGWLAGGQGSFSEYALVSADKIVDIPDHVSDKAAISALMQGITAQYLTTTTYQVSSNDVVLVHAAAGGVGQLLTQMAKLKGATVFGTVSTPAKAEIALGAGADQVFDYEDFDVRIKQKTAGHGADVVYDGVGATTFSKSLRSLRTRGILVSIGTASGPVPQVDINQLNVGGSLYLTRPTVMHHIQTRHELNKRAAEVFGLIDAGKIKISDGQYRPLSEVEDAFRTLESRNSTGKIILKP
ncbi:quinone oxidoreductase family protein [Brevibacterium zhoupengii]|uniref:quinone oxidoreductase family protein n=1 Tax=Brevibacterium zhoupengii TaxID=2898795 RepID=UPI001E58CFEC|nr:quinone oxidoreductase [Brevibacterium zhoupengii]